MCWACRTVECAGGAGGDVYGGRRRAAQPAGGGLRGGEGAGAWAKKERLEARLTSGRVVRGGPRRVAIVGAGIAGACAAAALVRRGLQVTVYDQAEAPGSGASGNPTALVMPRLDVGDGPASRALLEAWLFARRFYPELGPEAAQVLDAVHLPRGEREVQRFVKLLADPPLEETLLQAEGAGLRHVGAVAVKPEVALLRLMDGAEVKFGRRVAALDEIEADLVVVCAGMGVGALG